MIVLDGRSYETHAPTAEVMARVCTLATLNTNRLSSQVPHVATWKRLAGLPSADSPAARYVLLLSPDGRMVALGTWEFGAGITLAKGMVENLLSTRPAREPSPKRQQLDGAPAPTPYTPKQIVEHVARMDKCRFSMLHRVYAGCTESPTVLPPGDFRSLVLPPGVLHDHFVFFYANTFGCLNNDEATEAALFLLERVEYIGPDFHARMQSVFAKLGV